MILIISPTCVRKVHCHILEIFTKISVDAKLQSLMQDDAKVHKADGVLTLSLSESVSYGLGTKSVCTRARPQNGPV